MQIGSDSEKKTETEGHPNHMTNKRKACSFQNQYYSSLVFIPHTTRKKSPDSPTKHSSPFQKSLGHNIYCYLPSESRCYSPSRRRCEQNTRIHTSPPYVFHRQEERKSGCYQSREEGMILKIVPENADLGAPCTDNQLRDVMKLVMRQSGPTRRMLPNERSSCPSDATLRRFRLRHGSRIRFASPLVQEGKPFRALNAETVSNHFATLQELF